MVEGRSKKNGIMKSLGTLIQLLRTLYFARCSCLGYKIVIIRFVFRFINRIQTSISVYWRASVASETLTGVTQSKIGDVCLFGERA